MNCLTHVIPATFTEIGTEIEKTINYCLSEGRQQTSSSCVLKARSGRSSVARTTLENSFAQSLVAHLSSYFHKGDTETWEIEDIVLGRSFRISVADPYPWHTTSEPGDHLSFKACIICDIGRRLRFYKGQSNVPQAAAPCLDVAWW